MSRARLTIDGVVVLHYCQSKIDDKSDLELVTLDKLLSTAKEVRHVSGKIDIAPGQTITLLQSQSDHRVGR